MTRQLTITLDDDVAERLEEATRRTGTSVDEAVNDAVRRVFEAALAQTSNPFVVYARDLGARPDVNFDCAWKLLADKPVLSF
jgi:Ribbon-helix-helix protein, copG family